MFCPVDGEVYNNHALFWKVGEPSYWLRYCHNGSWAVSLTRDKDARNNTGLCVSLDTEANFPEDVKMWKVSCTDGKCTEQMSVRVKVANAQVTFFCLV